MGETWKAISLSGKINENEKVIVKEIKGLTLYVEPVDEARLKFHSILIFTII